MESSIIWHYTTEAHAMEILRDQVIKVSRIGRREGYKPAVWFSKQQFWEPTACKMFESGTNYWLGGEKGMLSQHEYTGIYRFGIEFNPRLLITWAKYKHISKLPYEAYSYMERSGIERSGHPSDWYACLNNVRSYNWVVVEKFDGENYVPVEIPIGLNTILSNVA